MSKPKPPTPPDPTVVANAQSNANIASATAQQKLNMIGTTSPYGTVNYEADPNSPGGYRQVTSLSPSQQGLYDQSTAAQNSALGIANTQIGRVGDALGQTVTPGQLTYETNAGPIQSSYQHAPDLQTGFAMGNIQGGVDSGSPLATSFQGAGPIGNSIAPAGAIQSQVHNPQALYGFNQGQAVQGDFGPTNYDQSVKAAQDAVYGQATSRLDPQFALAQRQQETALANQGLNPNSDAWRNAMDTFNRGRTDAYQQANFGSIAAGQAAQQQAFQQAQQQGVFHNDAAGQEYQQGMGAVDQFNRAAGQNFGQNLSSANYGLAAQGQEFGQHAQQLAAQNAGQQQQFSQNQQQAQFSQEAALADFQRALQSGQFANQAQAQEYAQRLGLMQAGNQASNDMQARYGQEAQFANQAQGQGFAQQQANASLNNQTQQQDFQQQWYNQQAPINQFNSLMSGAQVQGPQGINYTPSAVGATDVTGAYGLQQAQANANYQAQLQQQQSGLGGLFSLGSAAITAFSDVRLKRDIRRVGTRPDGLGLYLFRYLWSDLLHLGVMAQEVLGVKPEAVVRFGPWLAVDYGKL